MSSAIVNTNSGWKSHPPKDGVPLGKAIVTRQCPDGVFNSFSDLRESHPGSDPLLGPMSNLPVNLGSLSVLGQKVVIHPIQVPFFFVCFSLQVLVPIVALFADWENAAREQPIQRDSGGARLGGSWGLCLLLGLLLLLLLLCRS